MLKVFNLTKTFKGSKKPAVNDASFVVNNGEVYGLIGRNGAGKSTTIKCIMGLHPFEKGTITINGNDILKKANRAKQIVGYVPDDHSVYENLTGREYVNFIADVYKVKKEDRERRIIKYSKLLNMEENLDLQINGYSHGMRQKICIMGALVHEPRLWILDEPFLGLDAPSIEVVKNCINDFARNKRHMVLFTSHNLDTVIEMCDRVCVLDSGKVLAIVDMSTRGSKNKLKKLMFEGE